MLLSVIISNCYLEIKNYSISDKARIVLLSDLHGNSFGKGNKNLLKKITELQPDIICLAGDFIDEDNTAQDNAEFIDFLDKLTDIALVYYSYGNHDLNYFNKNGYTLIEEIQATGCIVLEEEYVDIEINNKKIRLGGIFDYAFNQKYVSRDEWFKDSTFLFLNDFCNTDRTKILMCHRPESFIYDNASFWEIDYVLCGHTHGGIWRLPFIGGVIAPEQGLFPMYDKGEYQINNIKMIISSGLSGYKNIPRLFNCPEITVIEI
ncbi:MAG: metallophosphoesterase [Clostridia bacterium]|nr:metallophosphoesterase [Clostridia bacterium]